MTETVKSWIEERRAIHAAAPGKWKKYLTTHSSGGVIVEDENEEMLFYDAGFGVTVAEPDNAIAIVDAHNTLPKLVRGVRKVLDMHRRATDLFEPSEFCAACSTDQRTVEYPCPTVRTIQEAINDE